MNVNTLFHNTRRTVLHAAVISLLIMAVLLMFPQYSSAASGVKAKGQINGSEGVNLRKSASLNSEKLAVIPDNTRIVIYREIYKSKTSTAKKKRWYYVKASGMKGYVRADCVDNVKFTGVAARVTNDVNYRKGPGTDMTIAGVLNKGTGISVCLDALPVKSVMGSNRIWFRILHQGKAYYVCSSSVEITSDSTPETPADDTSAEAQAKEAADIADQAIKDLSDAQFESFIKKQGFPSAYKKKLRKLHKKHPNWVFTSYKTGIKWNDALSRETRKGVSLVHGSFPKSYRSSTWKGQAEPGWYNASPQVVAYFMDPRNFLNSERIYMFENLSYKSEYQTTRVVSRIISGTRLSSYGFTAKVFVKAGKKYKISPVFLAARVRQETGGNSVSVNGSKSGGEVVYNPFNIGAYGSNPAARGLAYARRMGWTTPAKAVFGGAEYLASGYISRKQNSIYFQRFNSANGFFAMGTHQYMTNVMAPYSESLITKTSYTKYGISREPLVFVIPIYKNMPSKTTLP